MYIQNREKIEKLLSNLVKELVKQDIIECDKKEITKSTF